MNRLDLTDDNALVTTLDQLRQDLDALKNRQATSMASGVLGYVTQTGATWDDVRTVGTNSDSTTRTTTYTISWNGDGSQTVSFENIAYAIYANGNQLIAPNIAWTDGTRTASFATQPVTISFNTYSVVILVTTLKQVSLQFKAYAAGSQRGSIGVVVT